MSVFVNRCGSVSSEQDAENVVVVLLNDLGYSSEELQAFADDLGISPGDLKAFLDELEVPKESVEAVANTVRAFLKKLCASK